MQVVGKKRVPVGWEVNRIPKKESELAALIYELLWSLLIIKTSRNHALLESNRGGEKNLNQIDQETKELFGVEYDVDAQRLIDDGNRLLEKLIRQANEAFGFLGEKHVSEIDMTAVFKWLASHELEIYQKYYNDTVCSGCVFGMGPEKGLKELRLVPCGFLTDNNLIEQMEEKAGRFRSAGVSRGSFPCNCLLINMHVFNGGKLLNMIQEKGGKKAVDLFISTRSNIYSRRYQRYYHQEKKKRKASQPLEAIPPGNPLEPDSNSLIIKEGTDFSLSQGESKETNYPVEEAPDDDTIN